MHGGGGGTRPKILVGRCHGKMSVKMRGFGAGSSVNGGLMELTCRTRLAGNLAGCNPGALHERFAVRLAALNRPWGATERLVGKEIKKMMISEAAKTVKW